jgi:putative endonuclease
MFGWLAAVLGRLLRPVRAFGRGRSMASDGSSVSQDRLGPRSEQLARAFLERAGFRIIAANYRCPLGELDLVAQGEGKLVFVEVKARTLPASADPASAARPESAVHRAKQKKIGRSARYFCLARHCQSSVVRFDVIAIDWPEAGDPVIRHHKAAFRPDV